MGRYLIKIKNFYLEWSTIVDAPVTFGMNLRELQRYIKTEYGKTGLESLPDHLRRVEQRGTSAITAKNLSEVISGNRAGFNETTLTLEEIYQQYCLRKDFRP